MTCVSPLKGWKDRETGGITFRRENATEKMEVACGQCNRCRVDRARLWAVRIAHEGSLHEFDRGNCFVTLTYDREHLPADWSLRKSDFQKFMKRLRKAKRHRIRFYHVGEYGNICRHRIPAKECPLCNVGRPHYHAILFNHRFDDLFAVGVKNGVTQYSSHELVETWGKGMCHVGELNSKTANYVAGYCLKKITGVRADDHYMQIGDDGECVWVQPEYATMSRRPGIGRQWIERYLTDVYPSDEVPVPGVGVRRGVPRYYDEFLEEMDPQLLEEVKAAREVFRREHGDEYTHSRLMQKYKCTKARAELLRREL